MSQSLEPIAPDSALLPDEDHELIHISKLEHGKHNPRKEAPKPTLKQSIEGSGINRPLVVWYDSDREMFEITDGWQRYRAAINAGWEVLPVTICNSPREALERAKLDSAGRREWGPYDWAQFCQSMGEELLTEDDSKMDIARRVADAVDRTPNTVRLYLNVLSLPQVIHPLLTIGPEGSEKEWAHIQSYNEDARQYNGLRLQVADRLATAQSSISSNERVIAIAAHAVEFAEPEDAIKFIQLAANDDNQRLSMVRREVLVGSDHSRYMIVPRVAVNLTREQRQALMDFCHDKRQSLSDIVIEEITALAEKAVEQQGENGTEDSVDSSENEDLDG